MFPKLITMLQIYILEKIIGVSLDSTVGGSDSADEIPLTDLEAGVVSNDRQSSWRSVRDPPEAEPANEISTGTPETSSSGGFGIGLDQLVQLGRDRSIEAYNGVRGLSILLKTDLEKGIDGLDDEILLRRETFGSNTYPYKKGKCFWSSIWTTSQSPPFVITVLAAVIKSLLRIKRKDIHDGWYEEACIILLIVLVIIVIAITGYWQSCQFEKLTEEKRNVPQEVIRGGRRVRVSSYDIVVGDIVPLKNGGQVPADGVLFVANSLKIDEQEITGSRETIQKDLQEDPFLLSGSKLIEGTGTMLVTSVGMNTKWGLEMGRTHETDEKQPFQVYLTWLASSASWLVVLFALVACIVHLGRYFSGQKKNPDGTPMFILRITTADEATKFVIKSLSFGIATIIVAVPFGLSVAILLNVAKTIRKMRTEKALVQTDSACERMGYVTTILCHKTGILTLNQMSVVDVWAGGIRMQDMDNVSQLPILLKERIIEGIARNTNGSVVLEPGVIESEVYGSPTEQAILSFGNKLGMKFDDVRAASSVHHTIPFNPTKKFGGVALQIGTQSRVHWKGSAKIILSSCKEYMDGANNVIAIDEQKRKLLEVTTEEMCKKGMRCAALAYQPCERECLPTIKEPQNLVLLAIIGIKDPCRPGTKEAIQKCISGCVKVCMLTEDDVLTATAIAKEIFDDASDSNIMTGAGFRSLSDQERKERAKILRVLAQSCPSDHLLLLQTLREEGEVVAATGMGIHDPETLLAADVSLGMGIGGTAAAKEKSDIIISDDDIATIVKAIKWCRYLYTNIQKYVLFRLTVSASLVAICVVEIVFYGAFPFNLVQLLFFSLIIDIFGALALANRPLADHLMEKPPVGISDPLINKTMWSKLVLKVIYLVLFLAVMNNEKVLELVHGHTSSVEKFKNTLIYSTFVFCMVFGGFELGSLKQTFKEVLRDNMFLITIASTIIFQIIVIDFLVLFTFADRLDWKQWLLSGLVGLLSQFATHYPVQAYQYYRG